jgi:hypothetical protein
VPLMGSLTITTTFWQYIAADQKETAPALRRLFFGDYLAVARLELHNDVS